MEICTLASGSSGNCTLVSQGDTHILIDAGISCRRITNALKEVGVAAGTLSAVLITHEHRDHIAGLATLCKQRGVPVWGTDPTLRQLAPRIPFLEGLCRTIVPGKDYSLGELTVTAFPTSHDAAASVGYSIRGGGSKMALATDLGLVTPQVREGVRGADLLICEANHDVDWLRSGPYPYHLKARILGDRGHLSNEAGAELAAFAVTCGARVIILAHLSRENNTPARARAVVERRLRAMGADVGGAVTLAVASPETRGAVYSLTKEGAVW